MQNVYLNSEEEKILTLKFTNIMEMQYEQNWSDIYLEYNMQSYSSEQNIPTSCLVPQFTQTHYVVV